MRAELLFISLLACMQHLNIHYSPSWSKSSALDMEMRLFCLPTLLQVAKAYHTRESANQGGHQSASICALLQSAKHRVPDRLRGVEFPSGASSLWMQVETLVEGGCPPSSRLPVTHQWYRISTSGIRHLYPVGMEVNRHSLTRLCNQPSPPMRQSPFDLRLAREGGFGSINSGGSASRRCLFYSTFLVC
ncbi:hypothetical protein B0J15DRAFT_280227 [Fusarium solani]|uniref:Uncharacterized protein n=1 Tax=Fusarium solani TaxID=169388 RepID=A0A9P9HM63_FUSSL|nr:uncharacterized protein B0J15DRAFT_280227 [Fusarium solani]KAH7260194.1 hypothetical protein B0J15DRAFT_280227 [Fusarium solani]